MSQKDLQDALEVIRQELADTEKLDAGEVTKLQGIMQEIHKALENRESDEESLSELVSHSARRFEESHPSLTENLGRVADILQQMGF